MPRERHKLWVGKNDRAMPPPNVTLRIFTRAKGCCQECQRKLMAGEKWIRDHIIPLQDGGVNAETNIQILCWPCNVKKTGGEATERAKVRAKAKADLGIKTAPKRPLVSRGFPKRVRQPRDRLPALPPVFRQYPKQGLWPVGKGEDWD